MTSYHLHLPRMSSVTLQQSHNQSPVFTPKRAICIQQSRAVVPALGRGGWGRWKVYVGKKLGAAAKAAPDSREDTPGAFTKPWLFDSGSLQTDPARHKVLVT